MSEKKFIWDKTSLTEIKTMFSYDPETGILYRKNGDKLVNTYKAIKSKYYRVGVNGFAIKSHQICWALHYGMFSKKFIDHINGDPKDNRICNLRESTPRENSTNMKNHRSGKLPGSRLAKNANRWISSVWVNGRYKHLGMFGTEEEAHLRYLKFVSDLKETA